MDIMTGFERKNGSQVGAMARNLAIQLDCNVKTWTICPDGQGGYTVRVELVPIPDVKPLLEVCSDIAKNIQADLKRREDEGEILENKLAPPKGFPGWEVGWFQPRGKAVGQ